MSPGSLLRTGFTTGACAAAAARAATRALLGAAPVEAISIALPNGELARFAVHRCALLADRATCSVIKNGGDDSDCTHGAEISAEVVLRAEQGVAVRGGHGVATVTRPGLGLPIGAPAITPVPRRNIEEMVLAELSGSTWPGAEVTIGVPRGEELARATFNARLGLLGGISILGTTGIVRPFSTAAWRASVVQAIEVARAGELAELVFTTGGRTERFAMQLLPDLPELAFVQVGDDVALGLRRAARLGVKLVTLVAMVGKLAKVAAGALQTHVSRSRVDLGLLASLAAEAGAAPALTEAIARANTARHALELADAAPLPELTVLLCQRAAGVLAEKAGPALATRAVLVGFDGALRAACPALSGVR